ncbi:MAG: FAD binding domain-containing protein [Deltaproteobacteria bacterium]|nr:FAD binding domain-containing protein [Deltaproteobacteria bacterium]
MMPSFAYERPRSLEELGKLLENLEAGSFLFSAGATDVISGLKSHPQSYPKTLISLTALSELKGVRLLEKNRLSIGALTKLSEIAENALILKQAAVVAQTAAKIASPQIRNRATIAGNILVNNRCSYFNQSRHNRLVHQFCFKAGGDICHLIPAAREGHSPLCRARFVSDLAPVLLLLRATLQLWGPDGYRKISLEDFYTPDGIRRNNLKSGEIITAIETDLSCAKNVTYEKLRIRNTLDFPSVGVAVMLNVTESMELAVCYTGVNTHPVLIKLSDDRKNGKAMIQAACDQAKKSAQPLRQDHFPPSYRKEMIAVLIHQNLQKLGWKND